MSPSRCTDNATLHDSDLASNPFSNNQSSNQTTKLNKHKPSITPDVIKVISVNFCSLRSLSRQARLCGLIHEHKSDIIVGCESHLDDSYSSSEIFPVGFTIYRKDRTVGGGVYSWESRIH